MLICLPLPRSVYVQRFGLWNGQDHEAVLVDVQRMETVEQLEPYTCISLSRLNYFPGVCPLTFCVGPVASTVRGGFFPYLVQMINSMRGCVVCDDPWPLTIWPWLRKSCLDSFFLYLAQMITIIRGCVACYVFFRIWKFEFFANFWIFFGLDLEKNLHFSMDSFHI